MTAVTSFDECVTRGYPVKEIYPRECTAVTGELFREDIGNEFEKSNLITIENPRPNSEISSPLTVKGEARGYWFFEASFPVRLMDSGGNVVAKGIAQAQEEWMTEDFVAYHVTLSWTSPFKGKGMLILEKDNPSGLPQNADELHVPVMIR
jgi:hypothetical protein